MKEYVVYADVTMSVHAVVTANSEEEAEEIALQKINDNAFDYARKADACVDVEVVEAVKIHRAVTKKEIEENINVLEENGICLISNDEESYEFEAFTPAGGDMAIILDEPSKEKLEEYVENFDINEEVLMWWRNGRGNGLPFANIRDHYNDLEKYINKIDDVCDMLDY